VQNIIWNPAPVHRRGTGALACRHYRPYGSWIDTFLNPAISVCCSPIVMWRPMKAAWNNCGNGDRAPDPDARFGSSSDLGGRSYEVRFTSMSRHRQHDRLGPKSAKLKSGDAVAESPYDPAQRTLTGCQRSLPWWGGIFAFKPNPQLNRACSAYTENPFASGWRGGRIQRAFLSRLSIPKSF